MSNARRETLTENSVEKLAATGKKYKVWDTEPKNLAVVVTGKGDRNYYFIKRVNRRTIWHRICAVGEMPVKDVRKRAFELNGEVARGSNINEQRHRAKRQLTLKQVWDWLLVDIKDTKRSWDLDDYWFNKYLVPLHNKRLDEITTDTLRSFFSQLRTRIAADHKDSPRTNVRGIPLSNRLRCLLHTLFEKAKELGTFIGDNPVKKVKLIKEEHRQRYLTAAEEKRFLDEIAKEGQIYLDLYTLLLTLGQRCGNVRNMEWTEINFETKVWTIPAAKFKTKKTHSVPLCPSVMEILERRMAESKCKWVFPSIAPGKGNQPMCDSKKAFYRAIERAGLKDFRTYDCRHQAASNLIKEGASLQVVSLVLGHSNVLQSSRYTHICLDAQREFMDKLGARVANT